MLSIPFKNLILLLSASFCFGCATESGRANMEAAAFKMATDASAAYADCLLNELLKLPPEARASLASTEMVHGAAAACGVPANSMREAYARYGAVMASDGMDAEKWKKYGLARAEKGMADMQAFLVKSTDDARNAN